MNAFFIKDKKISQFIASLCMFYMCMMACLRDVSVGTDSNRYRLAVENGQTLHNLMEYVNNSIVDFCYQSGFSYTVYFTIIAVLTYSTIGYVLYKGGKENMKYGVLLFIISNNIYFIESMNAIRQLASSAVLFLLYYVMFESSMRQTKKKIISIILFLFAFGMHNASIVAVLIVFIARKKMSYKTARLLIFGIFIYAFLASRVLGQGGLYYILSSIEGLFGLHGYSEYIIGEYAESYNIIGLAVLLLLPSVAALSAKKYIDKPIVDIYIWGLLLLGLLAPLTKGGLRASQGLMITELLVIPFLLGLHKNNSVVIMYVLIYSIYFAYQLVTYYPNQPQIADYTFFF